MNPKIEDIAEEAADALRAMDEDSSFYEPVLLEFFGRTTWPLTTFLTPSEKK